MTTLLATMSRWWSVAQQFHARAMPSSRPRDAESVDTLWDSSLQVLAHNAKEFEAPGDAARVSDTLRKLCDSISIPFVVREELDHYLELIIGVCGRRSFVITDHGSLGLAPAQGFAGTKVGDLVCVLQASPLAVILRSNGRPSSDASILEAVEMERSAGQMPVLRRSPLKTISSPLQHRSETHSWIGGACIHGIMHGEWVDKHGYKDVRDFVLT